MCVCTGSCLSFVAACSRSNTPLSISLSQSLSLARSLNLSLPLNLCLNLSLSLNLSLMHARSLELSL